MAGILDILEAKEEIRDLVARYCHCCDFGRFDEWADCFTEDGVFDCPMYGRHAGRTELRQFVEDAYAALGKMKVHGCHRVVNLLYDVDVDSGRATGACYWSNNFCAEGKTELIRSGRYIDKIERVKGKWLFKERIIEHDSLPGK